MKNKLYIWVGIGLLICFLIGGYVLFLKGKLPFMNKIGMTNEERAFSNDLQEALSSHSEKNYDSAVSEFESLLARAENPADIASIQSKLAINLINRGLKSGEYNDDVKRGMDILWSVALGQDYPLSQRSVAMGDLGTIASFHGASFYKTYYTIPPFSELIADERDPYANLKAALRIFKYSDELQSNPYAKFSIVRMYTHLLANNSTDGNMTKQEMAESIQQYITEGDAALASNGNYREGTKLQMLTDRAKGFVFASYVLGNRTPEEREQAFKDALLAGESYDQTDKYVINALMELRFWYAVTLVAGFDDKRASDIRAIVAPFKPGVTAPDAFSPTRSLFVSWANQQPYTNFGQKYAVRIAEIAPDFKDFLVSVGWNL